MKWLRHHNLLISFVSCLVVIAITSYYALSSWPRVSASGLLSVSLNNPKAYGETTPIGQEVVSKRTKMSKTIYNGGSKYTTTFVSSPEYTRLFNGNFVNNYFQDKGTYYQLQHPWVSVRMYDSYTEIWDENFVGQPTGVPLVGDDHWTVQYQNKQGNWINADANSVVRSFQVVSNGIKLIKTCQTDIGQRVETYFFKDGSPLKITIVQNTTQAETIQFVWNLSGISNTTNLTDVNETNLDNHIPRQVGSKITGSNGIRIGQVLWNDVIGVVPVTPVYSSDANGKKITITAGTFVVPAGGNATLDPTSTFYPDADPETSTVDGKCYQDGVEGTWLSKTTGAGSGAEDSGIGEVIIYGSTPNTPSTDKYVYCQRFFGLFNTASLMGVAITSANFSLYGYDKGDTLGWTPTANVYSSNPASNTALVAGDYDSVGSTAFSDTAITYAGWSTTGYNIWALNAAGIAAINKTGITKFSTRSNYDISGTTGGPWVQNASFYMAAYYSEQGAGYKPTLTVEYTGQQVVYSPTANTGGWANPTNAYSSDNTYATRAPGYFSTNNASSGSANWTDPSNAYADGGGYAYITAANPSASSVWGSYGFSLSGYTIDQVRVRYDAWSAGFSSNGTYAYKLPGSDGATTGTVAVYPASPTSKWPHVDEFVPNNSDGIVLITNGAYQMFYGTANFSVPAGSIITNVSIVFTASDNADGTNKVTGQLNVNGTLYANSVNNEPPNIPTFTQFTSNWTQNPNTSANWTVDDVNGVASAAEIQQFGVIASDATPDVNVGAVYLRVDYTPPKEYDDTINVDVSWDSGSTWSASQNSTLTSSETTYWDNVTGVTSWTAAKLANGVFRVRALAQAVNNAEVVYLDWIPVEVTAHDTANLTHTFSGYGISLTGDNITKVEVGTEAFAASGEKIGIEVSWDAGGTWSTSQNTTALGASDPEAVTYLNFTSATTWIPAFLQDANFKVRITYVSNGYYGQISLDWLPVRISYIEGAAPVNYSANQTTYDFGVVQLSSTTNTTGNWITFTNSSTVTTNISVRMLASTWTAATAGWTHSDTAPGANTAAMKANSSNSTAWSSSVFITYAAPFNEIKQSVPVGANVVSGLSLLAPTSVTNGNTNNNTVRFSFYASSP